MNSISRHAIDSGPAWGSQDDLKTGAADPLRAGQNHNSQLVLVRIGHRTGQIDQTLLTCHELTADASQALLEHRCSVDIESQQCQISLERGPFTSTFFAVNEDTINTNVKISDQRSIVRCART